MITSHSKPATDGHGGAVALPRGWHRLKLADAVSEVQAGFAAGERDPCGVIQLRMNNVTKAGTWDWSSFIRVPADKATVDYYALRPGDVMFNNTNSTEMVGKSAVFEGHSEPVVFSNHFTRIRTNSETLEPAFLGFWLLSLWQGGEFARLCDRWIGQSAVQRGKLLALEIPLPLLPEQRRIAARLREQLAAVAEARAAVQAQSDAAQALPAAHLRAVFTSPTAAHWPRQPICEACELLPSKSIALAGDVEVRAITSACLVEIGFNPAGIKAARMWATDALESLVRPGEILIARSNTPDLVGRASRYAGEPAGVVASDLTIRLWPNTQVSGDFLVRYLSFLVQHRVLERQGGWSKWLDEENHALTNRSRRSPNSAPFPATVGRRETRSRARRHIRDAKRR